MTYMLLLNCALKLVEEIILFYVLFVCKCVLLPPVDNPIAVNKYIISPFGAFKWMVEGNCGKSSARIACKQTRYKASPTPPTQI